MPTLITKKDEVVKRALKDANTLLEDYINELLDTQVSREVPMLIDAERAFYVWYDNDSWDHHRVF